MKNAPNKLFDNIRKGNKIMFSFSTFLIQIISKGF